jgi:hypothetical protein
MFLIQQKKAGPIMDLPAKFGVELSQEFFAQTNTKPMMPEGRIMFSS